MDFLNTRRAAICATFLAALHAGLGPGAGRAQGSSPPLETIQLVGTCVTQDMTIPIADVEVTLLPQGLQTRSDEDGDFVFEWDGKESYLEFHFDDSAFCVQFVVRGVTSGAQKNKTGEERDTVSFVDVGPIVTAPTRQRSGPATAGIPSGATPPDEVKENGPDPNLSRLWFALRADIDRFGRVVSIDHHTGDAPPRDLGNALEAWMRTLKWNTPDLTLCHSPAFRTIIPMAYDWDKQTRTWKRDPNNRPR